MDDNERLCALEPCLRLRQFSLKRDRNSGGSVRLLILYKIFSYIPGFHLYNDCISGKEMYIVNHGRVEVNI